MSQFIAVINGETAEATAAKVQRQADSALKVQISGLEGDKIRKDDVTNAKEALVKAILNSGQEITNRDSYAANLVSAKEALDRAEKALATHQKTIEFFSTVYAYLIKE